MHRLPKHEAIRVFEGFAGYGGATFGLRRAKVNHKIIGFSEIDNDAIELYHYNFPNVPNLGDITKLDPTDPNLPDFDMFTGGFPCQPFSTVGKRQGVEDERGRGTLFGDIIRICEVKHPKYILLENVKGLLTGRMKATFNVIIDELHRIGYDTRFAVLNSKDYGIPQTRERLWIFAYLGTLPENFNIVPSKKKLKGYLADFLDKNPTPELYKSQKQIARIHEIHHNDVFDVNEPLCYDIYNREFLKFVAKAWEDTETPYFLCLDEMNLAPVEQYFAEYLSVIESRKSHDDGTVTTDPILEKSAEDWYRVLTSELTNDDNVRSRFLEEGICIPQNPQIRN